jgi:hypothetical protein
LSKKETIGEFYIEYRLETSGYPTCFGKNEEQEKGNERAEKKADHSLFLEFHCPFLSNKIRTNQIKKV